MQPVCRLRVVNTCFYAVVLLLKSTLLQGNDGYCNQYEHYTTSLKSPFELNCPRSQLFHLESCHCAYHDGGIKCSKTWNAYSSETLEDRRWAHVCASGLEVGAVVHFNHGGDQQKTFSHDRYDGGFNWRCPENTGVTNFSSGAWHQGHHDRLYGMKCTDMDTRLTVSEECALGGWSPLDGTWNFTLPSTNHIIAGISSYHSNHDEDRSFQFYYCPTCKEPVWSPWTSWPPCRFCHELRPGESAYQTRTRKCHFEENWKRVSKCRCQGNSTAFKKCGCLLTTTTTERVTVALNETLDQSENDTLVEDVEAQNITELVVTNATEPTTSAVFVTVPGGGGIKTKTLSDESSGLDFSSPRVIALLAIIAVSTVSIVVSIGFIGYKKLKKKTEARTMRIKK